MFNSHRMAVTLLRNLSFCTSNNNLGINFKLFLCKFIMVGELDSFAVDCDRTE